MIDWDKSCEDLRKVFYSKTIYSPVLCISERKFRWKDFSFDKFSFFPQKEVRSYSSGGETYSLPSLITNVFIIREDFEKISNDIYKEIIFSDYYIGPAFASILSFCFECLVITYPKSWPIVTLYEDQLLINNRLWPEMMINFLNKQIGLRDDIERFILPEEETYYLDRLRKILQILFSCDEEDYFKILRSMRFYQYALFNSRLDLNLTYSLLVQAIDIISQNYRERIKMDDVDPDKKIKKTLQELELYHEYYSLVSNVITYGSLTNQIIDFIMDNLSDDFWKKDHIENISAIDFHIREIQREKELLEYMDGPIKERKIKQIERYEKDINEVIERRPPFRPIPWYFNESRESLLEYYRNFPDRILRNTFRARSNLFHSGVSFPKYALETPFGDWIPEIRIYDDSNFLKEHIEHKWKIAINEKGVVKRECECGDSKEIQILLSIYGFERMVHNAILNYIFSLLQS